MMKAILLDNRNGHFQSEVTDLNESELPEGDVTVEVRYSTINYKDALAITNSAPVIRKFPMVPGIDLAGKVKESGHPHWRPGDWVIVNGWGMGEIYWGGLSQLARLSGDWVMPLPQPLLPRHAMGIGTAGYTAMLAVLTLERHGLTPKSGDILVTGASGGVGSLATALLAKLGYRVIASTGRIDGTDHLRNLGAAEVIDRTTLSAPGKPLGKERWAGAIDCVGSHTLANVCAGIRYQGIVVACGMAQGMEFLGSVAPFILRGITMVGIDSVYTPMVEREHAWKRLTTDLDLKVIDQVVIEIPLSEVIARSRALLDGKVRGRLVVDVTR